MTDRRRALSAEAATAVLLTATAVAVVVLHAVGGWPLRDVLILAAVTAGVRLVYIVTQRMHGLR